MYLGKQKISPWCCGCLYVRPTGSYYFVPATNLTVKYTQTFGNTTVNTMKKIVNFSILVNLCDISPIRRDTQYRINYFT